MSSRHLASAAAVIVFALFALGSGSSSDKATTTTTTTAASPASDGALGSCMDADKTTCREWHAWLLDERAAKGECTGGIVGAGRTWTSSACPTNPTLLGTCAMTERDAKYTRFEYKSPGRTSAISKDGCEASGGKWTDGPGADAPAPKASASAPVKPVSKPKSKK